MNQNKLKTCKSYQKEPIFSTTDKLKGDLDFKIIYFEVKSFTIKKYYSFSCRNGNKNERRVLINISI